MTEEVVVEQFVRASPDTVFGFFVDPGRWLLWQGVDAELDPVPGGRFRMNVTGDGYATGTFLEVLPHRRLVFTWGWEDLVRNVPPESSRVEIDLTPVEGGTQVRLTHMGLRVTEREPHAGGWAHYLSRLAAVATGDDPRKDPYRTHVP